MAQATPFLLMLSLALGAHSLSAEKCKLTGYWKNDLGSTMTISSVDEKGSFFGLYNTAVADNSSKIQESPLLGFQHLTNPIGQPTFGFTVNWSFSEATSVFTGQCFVENGREVLRTMWLFRRHENRTEDNWAGTVVGTNVFTRLE